MNPSYDRAAALAMLGNDESLLAMIGGIFVADWPEYRARMYTALANGDTHALRHLTHSVTGLVAYFAADEAERALRELEHAKRDGCLEHMPRLLGIAIAAVDELAAALKADTPRAAAPAPA